MFFVILRIVLSLHVRANEAENMWNRCDDSVLHLLVYSYWYVCVHQSRSHGPCQQNPFVPSVYGRNILGLLFYLPDLHWDHSGKLRKRRWDLDVE